MPRSQGELCGRLLAILERTEAAALGQSTVHNSQYDKASVLPRDVFPRLFTRRATHAQALARRGRQDMLGALDAQTEKIMVELDEAGGFPAQLSPAGQADFGLGYFDQRSKDGHPLTEAGRPTR